MSDLGRGRFPDGVPALRRAIGLAVHAHEPSPLLLGAVAGLVLGDVTAAREAGTRALAAARSQGQGELVPRAVEVLAYGELRTGCHDRADIHARAGVASATRTGQRNRAAHLHAVLAMTAAVRGEAEERVREAEAAGARAPWTTTCATSSPRSASAPGSNWRASWPPWSRGSRGRTGSGAVRCRAVPCSAVQWGSGVGRGEVG